MAAKAAADPVFRVGAHVIVQGVTARPELNGRTGVCEALDDTSGRWTIRFDVDNTLVKLQPKKLRALAQNHAAVASDFSSPPPVAECRRYDADAFFKNWDNVFLSLGSNRLAFGSSRDKAITRAGSQGITVPPDDLGKVFHVDSCRFRAVDEHKGCSHVMAVEFSRMPSSTATEFFAFDDRATRDGFLLSLQEKIRCKTKAAADAKAAAGRANAARLVQELPLPHGWEALVDSTGRLYYGNPSLKVTQYQHPGIYFSPEAEAATRAKAAAQAQPGAAAKPRPAVAGEKAFRVGAHVIVQGVTARPELNGRTGVCEALDDTSGRWTIRFDVDNTLVKLQPKKLRALAQNHAAAAAKDGPEARTAAGVASSATTLPLAAHSDAASSSASTAPPACIICMSDAPTHAFIPCGHKQICTSCAADNAIVQGLGAKCPTCRRNFQCILQIFEG